jgi:hypothetical protein
MNTTVCPGLCDYGYRCWDLLFALVYLDQGVSYFEDDDYRDIEPSARQVEVSFA